MNLGNLVSAIRHSRDPSRDVGQELTIIVSSQNLSINSQEVGVYYAIES